MIIIREIKIHPYLYDNAITWCVNYCYLFWLQAMWIVYEICGLITWYVSCCWNVTDDKTYLITGCTICCAKCQFHPFLPFSSITMPPSWKMLPVQKTPVNSTLRAYRLIIPVFVGFPTSLHIVDQNRQVRNWKIDSLKSIYNTRYTLHISHFLVNHIYPTIVNTIYYHLVNLIYSTIHIIPTTILHNIQSHSIQLYRYYNTVITL